MKSISDSFQKISIISYFKIKLLYFVQVSAEDPSEFKDDAKASITNSVILSGILNAKK